MHKVVSIDMGDTLIAFTPRRYEQIYNKLKDLGYSFSLKRVYSAYIKTLAKHNFPDSHGVNPFDVRDFLYELGLNSNNKRLIKEITDVDRGDEYWIYDDAIDFLEKARSLDYKLVLVSNATPRGKDIFNSLGLTKYFEQTIFSFEVGLVKPNPKIFSLIKLGKPEFHIGDIYEMDVLGAKRAGIKPLLLNRFDFYQDGFRSLRDVKLN